SANASRISRPSTPTGSPRPWSRWTNELPRRGAPPHFRTSPGDGAGKAGARTVRRQSREEGSPVSDPVFMRRALELAERAAGLTSPNPMVGAVLVRDSVIVGE